MTRFKLIMTYGTLSSALIGTPVAYALLFSKYKSEPEFHLILIGVWLFFGFVSYLYLRHDT